VQRSTLLSFSLTGAAALGLSSAPILPAVAKEESRPDDLTAIEVNLKDVVRFDWSLRGATQGAGTPNQAGVGFFAPLFIQDNSVWFLDAQAIANFADFDGYSSIINTEVAGTTISTSTRLGYRWLNGDRSWMYGVNAGYDSRPMNTGNAASGVTLYEKESAFFQQIAAGLEAVSDTWNFNAYALIPVGDTEQRLNVRYFGGAVDTYGLDVGYFITPELNASVGYYYQSGDLGEADGSGVQVDFDYQIADGVTAGINVSNDGAFETMVSAVISYSFGSKITAAETKKKAWQKPTIQSLSESVKNRNVRVHDATGQDSCLTTGTTRGFVAVRRSDTLRLPFDNPTGAPFHCDPGAMSATPRGWEPG
jgi:hypothetical protein